MKFVELCYLTIYDLKKNRKITYQLFRSFFLVCMIIFSGCLFYLGISKKNAYIVYSTVSSNTISTTLKITEEGNIIHDESINFCKWLEKQSSVSGYSDKGTLDLVKLCKKENWNKVNIKYVQLKMEGKSYQGNNDYSYDFVEPFSLQNSKSYYSVFFSIDTISGKNGIVNENDRKEFTYDYPKENIFLAGRSPQNQGEVVISDYILEKFGIQDNWRNYVGKKISFIIEGTPILKEYKIVGILNSNFFRLESHITDSQVMIYGDHDIYQQYGVSSLTRNFSMKGYLDTETLISKIPEKWESCYATSFFLEQYYYLTRIKLLSDKLVFGIAGILLLAVGINLYTILWEQSKHRKKTMGLLKAIGMETFDILKFQFLGYFFLFCFAFLFAFMLGFVLISAINSVLAATIYIKLTLSWKEYVLSSICATVILLFCVSGISYFLYRNQMKKRVSELLRK